MTDINTVDQITSVVDLFGPILQQTVLLNEFDREFAPLAACNKVRQSSLWLKVPTNSTWI